MRYYLHKQKSINILILPKSFFYTWVNISFNFRARKSYYIPNYCKLYEESTELYRFALAALERELELRKRVHFFLHHPLFFDNLCFYDIKFFPSLAILLVFQDFEENIQIFWKYSLKCYDFFQIFLFK